LSGGSATCSIVFNAVGNPQVKVTYGGDANYSGGSAVLSQTVNAASPTVVVAVRPPSKSTSVVGQAVSLVATVGPPYTGAPAPTGSVTFLDGGKAITCGTKTVVALVSGQATCQAVFVTAGPHSLTVDYLGDQHYQGLVSSPIIQTVTAAPTATLLIAAPLAGSVGQPVVYLALVVPTGGLGLATGPVRFLDGTSLIACNGATAPAPVSTNGLGVATCTVKYPATGTHTVTASFVGSAVFAASTSVAVSEVVSTTTTTTVGSSANPASAKKAVTYTAKVTAGPGGSTPTGKVVFTDNGSPVASCGRSAGVALTGSGVATCTVTYPSAGTHSIVARYAGTTYLKPSGSATLTEVIRS
jgi:hypothetical protein